MDFQPQCPVCGRLFKSMQGVNSHVTKAKSCSWWMKGKLRALDSDLSSTMIDQGSINDFPFSSNPLPLPPSIPENNAEEGLSLDDMDFDIPDMELHDDTFHFIPDQEPAMGEPGSGPITALRQIYRALDDEDDTRVVDIDSTAGKVLRMVPKPVVVDQEGDITMEEENNGISYAPFISELDWHVAYWAIKDGPGQKAFDRLLNIPGASNSFF